MDSSHIGPTIRIKGDVTSQEPLVISGQVDGAVTVGGHELTVAAGGKVTADLTADRIVIAGDANGKLKAESAIAVRETGRVEGEIVAPTVSFADGAYVRGHVEAAGKSPKLELLRSA